MAVHTEIRFEEAIERVLALPMPPTPPLDGAARAAGILLERLN